MSLILESHPHTNDVFSIDVQGEITFENSDQLRDEIDKLIEQNKVRIIIDLANLQYMSSAGMGVLVHGLKNTRQKNGDLRLINLGAKMRRVFLITQFTHHFEVFTSLEDAINSFDTEKKQVI